MYKAQVHLDFVVEIPLKSETRDEAEEEANDLVYGDGAYNAIQSAIDNGQYDWWVNDWQETTVVQMEM